MMELLWKLRGVLYRPWLRRIGAVERRETQGLLN